MCCYYKKITGFFFRAEVISERKYIDVYNSYDTEMGHISDSKLKSRWQPYRVPTKCYQRQETSEFHYLVFDIIKLVQEVNTNVPTDRQNDKCE